MKAEEILKEIQELKESCNTFAELTKDKIYSIMDKLDYQQSSVLSYNIDRLEHFIHSLNEFKLKTVIIQGRETGIFITASNTLEEAKKELIKYEAEDKENKTFTPNFYEIINHEKN